ncbi:MULTISPECIES: proline/glycine betaine ABC transporter permease [unclassified Rhizobium]|jgi:glycine betaine/proline transport system permease protein|uniref:ABC transporter permease n=1 Tax=Hyphomicrobiales TaxID=356 RepID=UPI000691B818|nr:ABC transporter permease subunit [Rhizobium sp. WW_1]RKD74060.1 glycine betaine/proline transport system permease protein [Rhizobium sp. WW_1]
MTMAVNSSAPEGRVLRVPLATISFLLLAGSFFLPAAIKTYPREYVVPFSGWIQSAMAWLTQDAPQISGLPPIRVMTRAIAAMLDALLNAVQGIIATGFRFTPGDGAPDIAPLPWFAVTTIFLVVAYRLRGRPLALVTALGLGFILITGNWASSMVTLSSVLVAAFISVVFGLLLGIVAYRVQWFARLISPVLDLMQTVPVFAYLVPVLILLGFGPASALAATIIYSMPPMIRNTVLGLGRVPPEISEFGSIAGCTERQLIFKVLVPSAMPSIMVGVNQVVMMTLNMVIIASMIGAGGLGFDVLTSLRRLDIGTGMEAGLAIVALAILLDRFCQAFVTRAREHHHDDQRSFWVNNWGWVIVTAVAIVGYIIAVALPSATSFPVSWVFTAKQPLNEFARWLTFNLSTPLDALKNAILLNVMVPVRIFMLGLPWFALPLLAGVAAWRLSGPTLSALVFVLMSAIFMAGLQQPAMMTIYLCGIGTVLSLLIGFPLGVLAAVNERAHQVLNVVCDTLQTLPTFVYLIPVVMLFKVGDFSALVAIVAFAIVPAIRYTDFGIRHVKEHFVEAAVMSGCTPTQTLFKVKIPLAVPEMLLGLSQTIVMALSMLVITALVGTRDLGQETYIALTKADAGRGVVAGLAIAFIAIVAERLIVAWRLKFSKRHAA